MYDIIFEECLVSGYSERTRLNAAADVTIAFAKYFDSAGEKLTKKCVLEQKKLYLPVEFDAITNIKIFEETTDRIAIAINNLPKKYIELNIAGNSIHTLKNVITQHAIDSFVSRFLSEIIWKLKLLDSENPKIFTLIRSGGQTGFDEAGIKAAKKLGYRTKVLSPKNWVFRNEYGDIANERMFKERFI